MALRYHPDKCDAEDAEERFKEVYHAYDVLSNDGKRAVYDEFGEEGLHDDGWGDAEAWRSLYKKVTEELIDDYMAKYKGQSLLFKSICSSIASTARCVFQARTRRGQTSLGTTPASRAT